MRVKRVLTSLEKGIDVGVFEKKVLNLVSERKRKEVWNSGDICIK
jgi:hypothetical protein